MQPTITIRPLRPAVAGDAPTTLDLLISIEPPQPPAELQTPQRPPLNLALVIDRSGSMAGEKISHARKAARSLAAELTSRDRLAIVTFDDEVRVVVPSRRVDSALPFLQAINTIEAGGTTALFDGWLAGALQVAEHLDGAALNRVLLLSDGQANEGLSDASAIAEKVAGLNQRGISTSAFGLGAGFDEDLMGAIAAAGDGTLAQIESPDQLADLYASELQGLATTSGRRVSIGIRPQHGAELVDVINDLTVTSAGNLQLPNLRQGQTLQVGLRLQLPAWTPNQPITGIRLAWDSPGVERRQELRRQLILPVLSAAELRELDVDLEAAEQLALLQASRDRRSVIAALDRGDEGAAFASLESIDLELAAMPQSSSISHERQRLAEQRQLLASDRNLSRKRLRHDVLRSSLNVWDGTNNTQED
ncbi:VWA domain-containing protein [Cyanobium sp. FACHB-13342]|uniref:vWA domain-containing protein n=1 Tax=Cyanobium sp. FACHB-13342 TaxID=2692793 RepID=UPI001681902F|nr:VWA domain-containing protein [Cyanobium sp. FACHB-13342]MBD2421891.1 VWA domain-containing protein [Cyanobium sp. FACHB-13342]